MSSAIHDLRDLLRGKHIDFQVPANLPLVRADPTLLHHILINLFANAAQHGGATGTITIEGRRTNDAVTLAIRDDGPGLAPMPEQRIFEVFTQGGGSDRHGGSGLGLAIVKGFRRCHGGRRQREQPSGWRRGLHAPLRRFAAALKGSRRAGAPALRQISV